MPRAIAALFIAAAGGLLPMAAHAEERDFCANRPGRGTPACTLAPGSAMVEMGIAAWEHWSDSASVEDDVTLGDALLRVGVTETTEVQLGVTSHVVQRTRDRATGSVERVAGIGDGTLAIRQSLTGPNGKVAIEAFATMPLAKRPIGSGEWSGGVLLPVDFELPSGFELDLTPELDAAANGSGSGHHLAWGGVIGLSHPLSKRVTLTGEVAAFRDEDPAGHRTDARATGSLAWQVSNRFQLDFEADAGLTAAAPAHSLALGFAWQFR